MKKILRQTNVQMLSRGIASVEAALILPILVAVTILAIDISQFLHMNQVLANASNEGARVASRDITESLLDVEQAIVQLFSEAFPQLTETEVDSALTISVTQNSVPVAMDLTLIESGTQLVVAVNFDFSQVRWFNGMNYLSDVNPGMQSLCRRE